MAWYRAFLPCMPWWRKLQGRNSTSRAGRSEDDVRSSTNKLPTFEERTITTSAKYVNGENVMTHIVMKTKRIDDRGCISDSNSHSTAETKLVGLSSNSISDQSTVVEENDAKVLEEPELFAVGPSYSEGFTGKRMVDVFYKISLSLDDLEMRGKESCVPESSKDPIEALFHYKGNDVWVYVPSWYAEARMISSGLY